MDGNFEDRVNKITEHLSWTDRVAAREHIFFTALVAIEYRGIDVEVAVQEASDTYQRMNNLENTGG